MISEIKLDFKDVLIRPKRSKTASRSAVTLGKSYRLMNSGNEWEGTPIIAANMSCVGTFAMAKALAKVEAMTALHKHYEVSDLADFYNGLTDQEARLVFYTSGIKNEDFEKLDAFWGKVDRTKFKNINVDVANGYTEYFQDKVKIIRDRFPRLNILAGNVATPEMVQELLISGAADIVKVGIGGGSVCTTRIMTGVGYPQLSAIAECADAAHGVGGHICGDGGCTCPGDVVKGFGANADFMMLGGMLAGHEECEGEWAEEIEWKHSTSPNVGSIWTDVHPDPELTIPGTYKPVPGSFRKRGLKFYGMSSKEAQEEYNGGMADYRAAEGKCVEVPYRGHVEETMKQIFGGIRSACAYVGAKNLKDLPKCTTFVRTTGQENTVFND
jgi:GMP reductase